MKSTLEKTEWFRKAEYGFFFHFLNSGSALHPPSGKATKVFLSSEEWNAQVNRFDVKRMAEQLHELRAGYAFLTVGQNSGYFCAPNKTYDEIMGLSGKNSKCSERDLVAEFSDELAKYNIPLLAYTTTQAPGFDLDAVQKLKSIPPWNCNANCGNYEQVKRFAGSDPRLKEFQLMWNAIHAEWMRRWGTKVRGWWVDGCYFAEQMYKHPDPPNGDSFADALRTNNPDALIAFNPGVKYPPVPVYPQNQDYTAGEVNEPGCGLLNGPMVYGMQYHILSFAGKGWGQGPLRFDGGQLAVHTRNVVDNGGVVSWDIPFTTQGIDGEVFSVLKTFAGDYRDSLKSLPKTSVTVIAPYYDEEGQPVAGKAEFSSETPAELTLEWGEEKHGSGNRQSWCINLPTLPRREAPLTLSCGGFSRTITVGIRRRFHFSEMPSDRMAITLNEQTIADYSFAVNDEMLRLDAVIYESESNIEDMPWAGSCLELFLTQPTKKTRQICIRADGKAFTVDNVAPAECQLVKSRRIELDANSYRLQAEVPLSLMIDYDPSQREFLLDIQQNVKSGGEMLRNTLFSVVSQSLASHARIKY
jgi:hypothetical protein